MTDEMLPPPTGTPIEATPLAASPDGAPAPRQRVRIRPWPFLLGGMAVAVITTVALAASAWTLPAIQHFHDSYVAWSEPIPDDVAAIAEVTGMSEEGELIYRASTPVVEDDDDFSEHCSIEGGAVLGCYYAGNVYVYEVTDERLAGTVEVTAAHEMLHAAYERLAPDERERIDALVDEAIAAIPETDSVFDDMELYSPSQHSDEWHSRLGTEFADLPAELEEHYARYFDDRAKVVELNAQATALFDQLRAQIDALVTEIDALDPVLDARIAAFEAAIAAYNADVDSFNARAANGSFSSQQQFDSERAVLVSRGAALDAEGAALDAEIDRYNGLVEQLTALDADYADLYSALDPSDDVDTISP